MSAQNRLIGGIAMVVGAIGWVALGLAFPTPGIIPAAVIWWPGVIAAILGIISIVSAFGGSSR